MHCAQAGSGQQGHGNKCALGKFNVAPPACLTGTAISAYYGYLKGVDNALALKHVPEVPPRNDTLAGPYGRRGDQVLCCSWSLMATHERVHRLQPTAIPCPGSRADTGSGTSADDGVTCADGRSVVSS